MWRLHSAHTGIESCLHRARDTVCWPAMMAEIKDYVQEYSLCNLPERATKRTTHLSQDP